ncbi:MAG: DUF1214 domain-containing protein [Deltaproteobacteria bacterium]|nr:DUF1214 domain-containing protein [Deltaproteobacteria bacterium]MBW2396378.1 DUF1214 domain-containing protein [Deltaproteobacteria bacterium]
MDRREFMIGASASTALAGAASLWAGLASTAQADSASPAGASGDEAAAAYAELAGLLGEIEARYIGADRKMNDAAERAAGRYFVAHALHHGFQFWFEADPQRPMFYRWFTPTKKLLGDNPDAVYYGCVIDPSQTYRIRGNVHGAAYTSFTAEGGTRGGALSRRLVSALNDTEFDVSADGSYEIIASPKRQSRNWLELDPDAGSITTRHYFEWERSAAADPTLHVPIWIEPLEDPGPAAPMDDAAVAAGIRRVVTFVRSVTVDFPDLPPERMPNWVSRELNQFNNPPDDENNMSVGYAAKDNVYRQAGYEIELDEALVIRGRFPRCRFANVMVWNHHMQTPPYRRRQVSLNRVQMHYESDGSFRIVVAHRDPGVPNWIDAAGARTGTIFWRFQLPEGDVPPLHAELRPWKEVRKKG